MRPWSLSMLVGALLLAGCDNQATYAEGCGPTPKEWITPREGRGVLSVLSVISVKDEKAMEWNGEAVSEATLERYLAETSQLNPLPVTQIKFSSAVDCATVRRLRALIARNLDCSYGKCAEGGGKWWLLGDVVSSDHPSEPYVPDPSSSSGTER